MARHKNYVSKEKININQNDRKTMSKKSRKNQRNFIEVSGGTVNIIEVQNSETQSAGKLLSIQELDIRYKADFTRDLTGIVKDIVKPLMDEIASLVKRTDSLRPKNKTNTGKPEATVKKKGGKK